MKIFDTVSGLVGQESAANLLHHLADIGMTA